MDWEACQNSDFSLMGQIQLWAHRGNGKVFHVCRGLFGITFIIHSRAAINPTFHLVYSRKIYWGLICARHCSRLDIVRKQWGSLLKQWAFPESLTYMGCGRGWYSKGEKAWGTRGWGGQELELLGSKFRKLVSNSNGSFSRKNFLRSKISGQGFYPWFQGKSKSYSL